MTTTTSLTNPLQSQGRNALLCDFLFLLHTAKVKVLLMIFKASPMIFLFCMKYMCLACETRDFVDIFKSFQTGLLLSPNSKIARAKRARIHELGHYS